MGEKLDQEDIQQSSSVWDDAFDAGAFKPSGASRTTARLFSLAILVSLVAWSMGFVFVSGEFGFGDALVLSLIPAFPLVIAVRLRCRWPAVRGSELALLATLLIVASGGVVGVVRNWYDTGMHRLHAEDVMYAELGRLLRRDPAFRNVGINLTDKKHIYWVTGTVASEADLERLKSLAAQCGITRRLDGPFAHSVSLSVEGWNEAR